MVNVRSRGKFSSGDHSRSSCGIEGYRRRETCLPHSTEETNVNSNPSGVKRKTVHPSPGIASAPSDNSGGSRKRARQQMGIASAASSRAVTGESAAGVVDMAVVDKQQLHSPVPRDYSVKAEVQLSL